MLWKTQKGWIPSQQVIEEGNKTQLEFSCPGHCVTWGGVNGLSKYFMTVDRESCWGSSQEMQSTCVKPAPIYLKLIISPEQADDNPGADVNVFLFMIQIKLQLCCFCVSVRVTWCERSQTIVLTSLQIAC